MCGGGGGACVGCVVVVELCDGRGICGDGVVMVVVVVVAVMMRDARDFS